MLQHGLAATAIIANPKLFPPDKSETWATKPQLTSHVEHYRRRHRGEARQCAGEFLSFMQNGGEVGVEIPTFEHIVKAIDSGALVMACMYARAMGSHEGGYHFVVISGYRDGELFINNPLPGSSRQSWKPADQFFFGLFASSMYEIDNGGLLVVGDSLK